jgi:tryptophanyl-tRNA synthetase
MKKIAPPSVKHASMLSIGNHFRAATPALRLAQEYDARYFSTDYGALNLIEPAPAPAPTLSAYIREVVAGLRSNEMVFCQQRLALGSFELMMMLMALTSKGFMHRAHMYKASVAANVEKTEGSEAFISIRLHTYPELMAMDILLVTLNVVPVRKDQLEHFDMAQDIAETINFSAKKDCLKVPHPLERESVDVVPGLA